MTAKASPHAAAVLEGHGLTSGRTVARVGRRCGAVLALAGLVIGLFASAPATSQERIGRPALECGSSRLAHARDGRGSDLRAGTTGDRSAPATTTPALSRTDDSLWCWGSDGNGQLGNGTDGSQQVPDRIGSFARWRAVSAGGTHTCALRTTGQLSCSGGVQGPARQRRASQRPERSGAGRRQPRRLGCGQHRLRARLRPAHQRTALLLGRRRQEPARRRQASRDRSVPVQVAGNRPRPGHGQRQLRPHLRPAHQRTALLLGYDSWGSSATASPSVTRALRCRSLATAPTGPG